MYKYALKFIELYTTELYTVNICRAQIHSRTLTWFWKLILWTEFSTTFNPTLPLLDCARPA